MGRLAAISGAGEFARADINPLSCKRIITVNNTGKPVEATGLLGVVESIMTT